MAKFFNNLNKSAKISIVLCLYDCIIANKRSLKLSMPSVNFLHSELAKEKAIGTVSQSNRYR